MRRQRNLRKAVAVAAQAAVVVCASAGLGLGVLTRGVSATEHDTPNSDETSTTIESVPPAPSEPGDSDTTSTGVPTPTTTTTTPATTTVASATGRLVIEARVNPPGGPLTVEVRTSDGRLVAGPRTCTLAAPACLDVQLPAGEYLVNVDPSSWSESFSATGVVFTVTEPDGSSRSDQTAVVDVEVGGITAIVLSAITLVGPPIPPAEPATTLLVEVESPLGLAPGGVPGVQLPETGSSSVPILVSALGVLALGVVLVRFRNGGDRRRTVGSTSAPGAPN